MLCILNIRTVSMMHFLNFETVPTLYILDVGTFLMLSLLEEGTVRTCSPMLFLVSFIHTTPKIGTIVFIPSQKRKRIELCVEQEHRLSLAI